MARLVSDPGTGRRQYAVLVQLLLGAPTVLAASVQFVRQ
jgi:hypothetical protein